MERYEVTMSTDGSCRGNPGPGGYAAVIRCGNHIKEISGSEKEITSNNRMELMAVLAGVSSLKKPCDILVRTDSMFVCNGIANAKERSQNGWRTKTGGRCAHSDLWAQLDTLAREHNHRIRYQYVKGHDGDPDNERANELAQNSVVR